MLCLFPLFVVVGWPGSPVPGPWGLSGLRWSRASSLRFSLRAPCPLLGIAGARMRWSVLRPARWSPWLVSLPLPWRAWVGLPSLPGLPGSCLPLLPAAPGARFSSALSPLPVRPGLFPVPAGLPLPGPGPGARWPWLLGSASPFSSSGVPRAVLLSPLPGVPGFPLLPPVFGPLRGAWFPPRRHFLLSPIHSPPDSPIRCYPSTPQCASSSTTTTSP